MLYGRVRPLLFRLDPEDAHQRLIALLEAVQRFPVLLGLLERLFRVADPRLEQQVFGLRFANPVGLAAGFDKNARITRAMAALGFGHVEIGSVTLEPRTGNPRPRVVRLVEDEALVNRLGFPNEGAEAIGRRLARLDIRSSVLGVNLGTGTATGGQPEAEYALLAARLGPHAGYLAVNVSSPNTPGVRDLQAPAALAAILQAVRQAAPGLPLLVKLSPDLSEADLEALLPVLLEEADGAIATNTALAERGGLSGRPLGQRSTEVVRFLYREGGERLPVIGVGGVFDARDAWEKITAGASLVQLYTGLIYDGPGIAAAINRGLLDRLDQHGLASVGEAVGIERK